MSETGLVALVGVIGTLVGAIGGAWIARNGIKQQITAERRYDLEDETRAAIVRLMDAAREWRDAVIDPSFAVAHADSLAEAHKVRSDALPLAHDTDHVVVRARVNLRRALTEADLLVTDERLRAALEPFRDITERWWTEIIEGFYTSIGTGVESTDDRIGQYDRFDDEVLLHIRTLGDHAREALIA